MDNLSKRLRQARLETHLSQSAAAQKMDMAQTFLSLAERGDRRITVDRLAKFAKLYKKPMSWFFEEAKLNDIPESKSEIDDFLNVYLPEYDFKSSDKQRISEFLGKVAKEYVKSIPKLKKKRLKEIVISDPTYY